MLEVALAGEATARASNPDVKTFANLVIRDDSKVGRKLTRIARQDGLQVLRELC